jgi:hypothetical protein
MKTLLSLLILVIGAISRAAEPDIVFADFEGPDYGGWKAEGRAFGSGPAHGALPDQKPVTGFLGHGLVNSKLGGDKATGTLTSPDFAIHRKFITFLIGGGGFAGQTCMNLLVDGKVARTATGQHTKSGGDGVLLPASWDVSDLAGKTARIEIVDSATGSWGHITVDQIVFTDSISSQTAAITPPKAAPAPAKETPVSSPTRNVDGETLYNGIHLPAEWPPRDAVPKDRSVSRAPYLDHPPEVIPIDVGRQLFVDDFLIESTTLKREFHYPQRYVRNPILKPETPIELNGGRLPLAAMISDGFCFDPQDRLFKLWYHAGWRDGTMLATSHDGLHFERPNFDVTPGTNRVLPPRPHPVRHGTGICIDPYTTDAQQRFKMLLYEDTRRNTTAYTSPDGIHWAEQGTLPEAGDNTTMFYNPFRKKWVISIRLYRGGGRARNYRESSDFLSAIHWDKSESVPWAGTDVLDIPDPAVLALMPKPEQIREEARKKGEDYEKLLAKTRADYGDPTQLYNLDAIPYESLMLGVFGIHRGPANKVCEELKRPKICDLELAYSRDGFHWDRPDRTPFLASTRKQGDWDRAYLHAGVGLCCVVGDKLWFYYSGWSGISPALGANMYAGGSTGVAFLRRDGFASMNATTAPGTLTTRAITFKGRYLFVNVNAPKGELRAEILGEDGKVIAPYTLENSVPIRTDTTHQRMIWKSSDNLGALAGKRVKIRFQLTAGELYSFWVTPDDKGESHGYVASGGPEFTGPMDVPANAK